MVKLIVLCGLVLFVAWGATTRPGRLFSWTMYSGSSKGFLWTDLETGPRVPSYAELRLAPDSHYLGLADLERLQAESERPLPVKGLILSSRGSVAVEAVDGGRVVAATPLPPERDVDHLVALVERWGCRRP